MRTGACTARSARTCSGATDAARSEPEPLARRLLEFRCLGSKHELPSVHQRILRTERSPGCLARRLECRRASADGPERRVERSRLGGPTQRGRCRAGATVGGCADHFRFAASIRRSADRDVVSRRRRVVEDRGGASHHFSRTAFVAAAQGQLEHRVPARHACRDPVRHCQCISWPHGERAEYR